MKNMLCVVHNACTQFIYVEFTLRHHLQNIHRNKKKKENKTEQNNFINILFIKKQTNNNRNETFFFFVKEPISKPETNECKETGGSQSIHKFILCFR